MESFEQRLVALCEAGGISSFIFEIGRPLAYYRDGKLCKEPDQLVPKPFFDGIFAKINQGSTDFREDLDKGYTFGKFRFRINLYRSMGQLKMVLRLLPLEILPIHKLGIPERALEHLCSLERGLVLVTGPTGCGKSTTIASLLNYMAPRCDGHIVTLEDPIENLLAVGTDFQYRVSQRSIGIGEDVETFGMGMRSALRQEPKIIFCGEIRDLETARLVVTAAQTGHLVFSTLHTGSAPASIRRLIDMHPSDERDDVSDALAEVMQAIICQRLEPRLAGKGRVALHEILLRKDPVPAHIRCKEYTKLAGVIETGRSVGHQNFKYIYKQYEDEGIIDTLENRLGAKRAAVARNGNFSMR